MNYQETLDELIVTSAEIAQMEADYGSMDAGSPIENDVYEALITKRAELINKLKSGEYTKK